MGVTEPQRLGVARDYAELQAILREYADATGLSRAEIDRVSGLPDRFASKALAPVPIGTCRLGAKTLGPMLGGLGVVLIVARADKDLYRIAKSATKRRENSVRARLLSMDVFNAAKRLLARQNGKLGGKAVRMKRALTKRQKIAKRAALIRWQNTPKDKRSEFGKRAITARWAKAREHALSSPALMQTLQLPPR